MIYVQYLLLYEAPSKTASFYLIFVLIISVEKEMSSKKIVLISHKIRWVLIFFS